MGDILIICEHEEGNIKKYSRELAFKSAEIASKLGISVHAVFFGKEVQDEAATLGAYGVGGVTVVSGDAYGEYNSENYLNAAMQVIGEMKPTYVFASASNIGKDLLPRIAVRSKAGMASECIDLMIDGDTVTFRRPVYAGKAWVDVKINSEVKCASMRPNVFTIGEVKSGTAVVTVKEIASVETKVTLKEKVAAETKQVDLVEANVIVSGGRAMGSADNYKVLKELAELVNASIGASRAAVDAGYISHDHQVGQTGKTVNPTLYIACGISGAIQHLAGMRTSKYIIAINKDPEAPIFTKADFGIVGDLFKVVPAVTARLKKLMSE